MGRPLGTAGASGVTQYKSDLEWLSEAFGSAFRPTPRIGISEWTENNLSIAVGNSEPGPIRLDRTPYIRQVLEDMSPWSAVQDVVLEFGTQLGKTQSELDIMGYYIAAVPTQMIFAFSSDDLVKTFVKSKFDPMIQANPNLASLVGGVSGDKRSSNLTFKTFPGGFIVFGSITNPKEMRSHSCRITFIDEADAGKVLKEGDVTDLIAKRTNTFGDKGKHMVSSTPVNGGIIEPMYKAGTRYRYWLKCPHCGQYLTLEWDYMRWTVDKEAPEIPTSVWMECPHCKGHIRNSDKYWMYEKEQNPHWIAENPQAKTHSYHLSSLYSPVGWLSWESIVSDYLKAVLSDNQSKMITFYNTHLAMEYDFSSRMPDWRKLMERSRDPANHYHRGVVPSWVSVITTAGDVQGDRLEVTVMGWGTNLRCHVIDHIVLYTDDQSVHTESPDCSVWNEYQQQVLDAEYIREDGAMMRAVANALDRSYNSETLNMMYGRYMGYPFYPIHGEYKSDSLVPSPKQARVLGRNDANAVPARYWSFDEVNMKLMAYGWLRLDDNDAHNVPHYTTFANDLPDEYFHQLCSERWTPPTAGRRKGSWEKVRDRNEALDCYTYNIAMAYLKGIYTFRKEDWDELERMLASRKKDEARNKSVRMRVTRRRLRSGGFM